MLLQTMHDIVGNSVAFFFRQFPAKSAHELAYASQGECNSENQHVPPGTHKALEQIGNSPVNSSPYVRRKGVAGYEARLVGLGGIRAHDHHNA